MRTVGMGTAPKEENQKLLSEIAELKAEKTALEQELVGLRAKRVSKKERDEAAE